MWINVALALTLGAVLFLSWRMTRQGLAATAGAPAAGDDTPPGEQAAPVPLATASRDVSVRTAYETLSRQAGFATGSLTGILWASKIGLGLLLPLLVADLVGFGSVGAVAVVVFALIGFFTPDLYLLMRRRERQQTMRRGLSYFVDMIVAFLLSGLGLEEAFRRAGRSAFPPKHPLAVEAALVTRELDGGRDRNEAFQALGERTGLAELRILAAAMRMGLKLGAPVRETLEAQADLLRLKRREEGLGRINRMVVYSMFPVLLCGLPVLLVFIFFPTVVEIGKAFSEVRSLTGR